MIAEVFEMERDNRLDAGRDGARMNARTTDRRQSSRGQWEQSRDYGLAAAAGEKGIMRRLLLTSFHAKVC